MDAKRPCPDSALLAAFIDGTLVNDDRSAVVAHLTECAACRCTAANVAAFQEVLERERSWESAASPRKAIKVTKARPRRRWTREQTRVIALTLAGAAALAVVLSPLILMTQDELASPLTELINASGGPRSITARVSGGFRYGPPPALQPTPAEVRGRWRLASAAGYIRETYEDDPLTTSQHAVGVAALIVGRLDDAVSSLFRAAAAAPNDARILNDLAAAYYERAVSTGHADDLPRALSVVERVLVQSPDSADGWFNRALIISALGLRAHAREAWNVYLQKDKTSPWAAEARDRLAALSVSASANDWPGMRQRLESGADQPTVDEAVRRFASRVREYLDRDVFTAWASRVEGGEDATVFLQRAEMIGDAFQRISGDDTYSDALAIVRRVAKEQNHRRLLELARAHREYGDGLRLFATSRFTDAAISLRRAESILSATGSPLGLRARIEIAGADYYVGRLDAAQKPLAHIKAAALAGDYSNILARADWLNGLIAFARNDFGAAQVSYEEMFEAAAAAGDIEQQAFARGLLANLFDILGEASASWRHRVEAAALIEQVSNPTVVASLLLSAAGDASTRGHHPAALVFATSVLEIPGPINPALEIQALSQRSRTLHRLGRHSAGADTLRLAHERLARLPDGAIQDRLLPDVLSADAEAFRRSDPTRALAAAERALTLRLVQHDPLRLARFSAALAELALDRNELDRAQAAIQRGIAAFEPYRDLPSAEMRIGSSDPSWTLFVKAVQVALLRGDTAQAFEYSERRRIQASLEHRQWGEYVVSLAELQRKLSADTALLVLTQMDDHLQIWTIRQREVTTHTVSISAEGASSLVAAHLYEVAAGAPIPRLSGDLFDQLLQPVMPSLTGVRNLVVLPDGPYQRVAFAALWDRTRNRYVVEDRTVVEAPSATAYVWALARGAQVPVDRLRQAVVIDSATIETEHEADVRNRFNDREVATLYPDAEVRRGEAATAKRLMNHRRVRDVIHVAAPLHPNDEYPFLSRLLLADIRGQKHSGAVFARHVLNTELSDAKLVTLEPRHERNAISHDHAALGFSRALLAAGVPNVVGPIAAVGAQQLEQSWLEFHRHYSAGLSAAESLRRAQLTALSESNHRPGPWAMLTVFGSTQ